MSIYIANDPMIEAILMAVMEKNIECTIMAIVTGTKKKRKA
jgi:hypothetical protein